VPDQDPPDWPGVWVRERLGIDLVEQANEHPEVPGRAVRELTGLGLRRNPRRVHLLVSPVLAKHVPADPKAVLGSATALAGVVSTHLAGHEPTLVLGFAETATGLGHMVAAALGAPYLHSTRRGVGTVASALSFAEEHSHAVDHHLVPHASFAVASPGPVVLVDDELSTGRTALNTIRALHKADGGRCGHYVVAALLDLRSPADEELTRRCASELGIRIDMVGLGRGEVVLPDGVGERAGELVAGLTELPPVAIASQGARHASVTWPDEVAHHGRHGIGPDQQRDLDAALATYVVDLAADLGPGSWHVLGTEELMYLPVRVAAGLADLRPDDRFTCSSTTRSPIVVIDDPGYPIRSALTFSASDEDDLSPRHAYNLAGIPRILLFVDDACDRGRLEAPDGLVTRLVESGAEVVVAVVPARVPEDGPGPLRGPSFGSYPATDVGWLLTDLSDVVLEAPRHERESLIQAGVRHYAESLPIEYLPSPEYQQLFAAALESSGRRVAQCVGVAAELVLERRGPEVVLASLARAGTPVGILMRHWLADRHGLDVPHFAVSIVRGKGIDEVALRWLAAHHDPASVMFVDGWTGKGMITRELEAAVSDARERMGLDFSSDLAVLADTGNCVDIYGTRDDFLIPSACLNSTVSGLVSRTVLRPDLIGPNRFHGAKHYAELAPADRSREFIAAIRGLFADVADAVDAEVAALRREDRAPTWAGQAVVAEVGRRYGIADQNLIKPGVGETTRVLLRRVPWKVLLRAGSAAEVPHIVRLAHERGVEVVEVPELAYTTIGLIKPMQSS